MAANLDVSLLFTIVGGLLCCSCTLSYENLHCAVRKDISPCTCDKYPPTEGNKNPSIKVKCQKMTSFSQVVLLLKNKFDRGTPIMLSIEHSKLDDLSTNKFSDINSDITKIFLPHNQFANISDTPFEGINDVKFLSLSDNKISEFPGVIFKHMPNIEGIEVSRTLIKHISPTHFESLQSLQILLFSECNLTIIQNGTFPNTLNYVHLGSNNLTTLNQNLRFQRNLKWLYMQNNHVKSLENELPDQFGDSKLMHLEIWNNAIHQLPQSFRNLTSLNHFLASGNKLTSIDNVVQNMKELQCLDLSGNRIQFLSPTEFAHTKINNLTLAYNEITSLNKSILPLVDLRDFNVAYNRITEFSFSEVAGLFSLSSLQLSHNKITKVTGFGTELQPKARIPEINLDFNEIEILEGSLGSIAGLTHLNMSHNKLRYLPAHFLQGLDNLKVLDVSHNFLRTLEDTSKIVLPSLNEIKVMHNELTTLAEDFHGFPVLCWADLSFNKIRTVKAEFTERTQCEVGFGVNGTLRIYLNENSILCNESMKQVIKKIESRNNSTEFHGTTQCPSPKEELKYNVTNADSSPITVITLDKR